MHVRAAVGASFNQFIDFTTEVSVHDNDPAFYAIRDHAPALLPLYLASRQNVEHFDVNPLNFIHVPVGALALAALIAALFLRGRFKPAPTSWRCVSACLSRLSSTPPFAACSPIPSADIKAG